MLNTKNEKKGDDEFETQTRGAGEKKRRKNALMSNKLLSVLVEILILLGVGVVFMVLRNDLSIGEAVPPHACCFNTHTHIHTHAIAVNTASGVLLRHNRHHDWLR